MVTISEELRDYYERVKTLVVTEMPGADLEHLEDGGRHKTHDVVVARRKIAKILHSTVFQCDHQGNRRYDVPNSRGVLTIPKPIPKSWQPVSSAVVAELLGMKNHSSIRYMLKTKGVDSENAEAAV